MVRPLLNLLLATALAVAAGAAPAWGPAEDEDFSYMTLKGIRTVAVEFTGFHPDYRRYGVAEAALRGVVEARLRDAGLEVITKQEAVRIPGAALLRVEAHVHLVDSRFYSYSLSLKLRQKLPLPTSPEAFVSATIWSTGTTGITEEHRLGRLNGEVATLLDRFLAAHAAQNRAG